MTEPISVDDLMAAAGALNLPLVADRLEALLPEVQRLRQQAGRLRGLPLETEEPAARFAPE